MHRDDVAPIFDALLVNLTQIRSDLQWAYADGYWPTAPNRDAPTRISDDPDAGPMFDIGLGNYNSREAYRAALMALSRADMSICMALSMIGLSPGDWFAPEGSVWLPEALQGVERIEDRLTLLSASLRAIQRPIPKKLGALIVGPVKDAEPCAPAKNAIERAARVLLGAVAKRSDDADITRDPVCSVCQLRPVAMRKAGRCETCASYLLRHGVERPQLLDAQERAEALARQAKRKARGEGFGLD